MLRTTTLLILALASSSLGCGLLDSPTASGSCTGKVGTTSVEGALSQSSEFHRDDMHLGMEAAFLNLSTESGALTIAAHLADMPSDTRVGTHPLAPLNGYVDRWELVAPSSAPALSTGTFTLTSATRDLLDGSFEMSFADGSSARCEFSIPRDVALDTDD